jgi:hypothetical protein
MEASTKISKESVGVQAVGEAALDKAMHEAIEWKKLQWRPQEGSHDSNT